MPFKKIENYEETNKKPIEALTEGEDFKLAHPHRAEYTTYYQKYINTSEDGIVIYLERAVSLTQVLERVVTRSEWQLVKQIDCFCCSCPPDGGSDAACRNHGHYGKRPCEDHGTPGYEWEDTNDMPDSVQVARAMWRDG